MFRLKRFSGRRSVVLIPTLSLLLAGCASRGAETEASDLPDVAHQRVSRIELDSVVPVPAGTAKLRVWVPVPSDNAYQRIEDLKVEGPAPVEIRKDSQGNRVATLLVDDPRDPVQVTTTFRLLRRERDAYDGADGRAPSENPGADPKRALEPSRMVPISPAISAIADREVAGATGDLDKLKRLYDWSQRNMKYDKSGEGWGRGDAVWACNSRRGNCTDFHSALMAMARSEGVPARFVMGFPLPPDRESGEVNGYHCWAEFWVPQYGWLPLDASEASKHPELRKYYFGRLTPDRFAISTGRDLVLDPPQNGDPLNFLWKPYAEADGREVSDVKTVVRFRPA